MSPQDSQQLLSKCDEFWSQWAAVDQPFRPVSYMKKAASYFPGFSKRRGDEEAGWPRLQPAAMPSLDAYGLPPQPQSQAHDLPTLGTELQEISAEPQLQHLTSMEGQQSVSHVPPPTPPPFASPPDKVVTSGGQPSCTPPSIAQNTATFQPVTDEPFRIRIPPALLDRAHAARRGAGRRWKALPRRSVCTGFCTGMGAVTQSVRLLLGTILGWALVSISLVLFLGLAMQARGAKPLQTRSSMNPQPTPNPDISPE